MKESLTEKERESLEYIVEHGCCRGVNCSCCLAKKFIKNCHDIPFGNMIELAKQILREYYKQKCQVKIDFKESDNMDTRNLAENNFSAITKLEKKVADLEFVLNRTQEKKEVPFHAGKIYQDSFGHNWMWLKKVCSDECLLYDVSGERVRSNSWSEEDIINCINDNSNKHKLVEVNLSDILKKALDK